MNLLLSRHINDDHGTVGALVANGSVVCLVGELPWRNNRSDLSCIPGGRYRVKYLARSASGRYRDVYHVTDVPLRSGILIHAGNLTGDKTLGLRTDSHGCLLPGLRLGRLSGQRAVLSSRGGLDALHAVTGRQDFDLDIEEMAG